MPNDTHETAPTQSVQAGDVQFAYRRFGPRGATPLLLLNYFAAHMDNWDPKITNGFAAEHDVILVDYPGIGRSSGQTPSTVAALTSACVAFCRAIGLTQFDAVGFSQFSVVPMFFPPYTPRVKQVIKWTVRYLS